MLDELPIWVRTPATYKPEGDHIICRWEGAEWIMSIHIAQETVARITEALAKWELARLGAVVQFIPRHH